MGKRLFIHCFSRETRVVLLDDDNKPIEYFVERPPKQRMIGNIYKGKVENVLPGMQAAFVDIGLEKNAFLYVDEIVPSKNARSSSQVMKTESSPQPAIQSLVSRGETLLVQVHKEAVGHKGAKVTTNMTLPGRYLVYLPYGGHIGVSRQIEEELERERLKEIGQDLVEGNEGLIIRTVCEGVDEHELAFDMRQLRQRWLDIQEHAKTVEEKELIYHEADIIPKLVRDYMSSDLTECYIDSPIHYRRLKQALHRYPELQKKVKLYDQNQDMFDYFQLTSEIEKAIRKRVWLKSGGYMIFDQTEALTVIDVNTGKFVGQQSLEETVLRTNLEAATEIARQLRLRDIGGIVIIDFIDMIEPKNQQHVLSVLEHAVKRDRTKTTVVGLTSLGLVELTRKKVRQSLLEVMTEPCTYCEGKGFTRSKESLAGQIERMLLEYRQSDSEAVLIEVHPELQRELEGAHKKGLKELQERCGFQILVYGNKSLHLESYKILYQGQASEAKKRLNKLTAMPVV
ncbi:Rne/Rng family ribonuclease [Bacillus horti]|uniref:Ribonuclease G n=1 Tax=Caldalkalibacillus horti TaxID=77523 RepID=A0ABT9VTG6_9BACI|nr:Rne/Rng family ribonuclease [Bacillus horti]MDQ0164281.1 ribonuclease G [Bacillus horti]